MKELLKLYDKMTPRELAVTAFTNFVTDEDEDGVERILTKVPRHNYTMTDVEWGQTIDTLFDIAKFYGWIFSDLRANRAERLGIVLVCARKAAEPFDTKDEKAWREHIKADEDMEFFANQVRDYESEMQSLHRAVKDLCEERGYPLEQIRTVAGVNPYVQEKGEIKTEYVKKYADAFRNLCGKHARA